MRFRKERRNRCSCPPRTTNHLYSLQRRQLLTAKDALRKAGMKFPTPTTTRVVRGTKHLKETCLINLYVAIEDGISCECSLMMKFWNVWVISCELQFSRKTIVNQEVQRRMFHYCPPVRMVKNASSWTKRPASHISPSPCA